jgi:hypothetical protein
MTFGMKFGQNTRNNQQGRHRSCSLLEPIFCGVAGRQDGGSGVCIPHCGTIAPTGMKFGMKFGRTHTGQSGRTVVLLLLEPCLTSVAGRQGMVEARTEIEALLGTTMLISHCGTIALTQKDSQQVPVMLLHEPCSRSVAGRQNVIESGVFHIAAQLPGAGIRHEIRQNTRRTINRGVPVISSSWNRVSRVTGRQGMVGQFHIAAQLHQLA